MKYGDEVFYMNNQDNIESAIFCEDWEWDMAYIEKEGKQLTIDRRILFSTKEEVVKVYIKRLENSTTMAERLIEKYRNEIVQNGIKLSLIKGKYNG